MPATIQDIADQLGLSLATVSRSLRNDRVIHPQTRARVIEAAQAIGYQGRTRRRRSSRPASRATLGVLLAAETLEEARTSPVVTHYLEGMTAEADADADAVVLSLQTVKGADRGRLGAEGLVPLLVRRRVWDVAILQGRHDPADAAAIGRHVPVVTLNWPYPGRPVDFVGTDDVGGCAAAVERLVALGHRRFAWIAGPRGAAYSDTRRAGFMLGCVRHGLDVADQTFIDEADRGRREAAIVGAAREGGVTAFVAVNDGEAGDAAAALAGGGVRVPEDVSVCGFDDVGARTPDGKRITSVDPRFVEMGRLAVRQALARLAQPAAAPLILRPAARWVEGQTTAAAPGPGRARGPRERAGA